MRGSGEPLLQLKQRLVGTSLGRAAKHLRSSVEMLTASPEEVGCLANDQLAEYLVTRLAQRHFVDVGAHIGSIVSQVKVNCPSVKITAIEPVPAKATKLRQSFPDVTVIQSALSDEQGSASFFVNGAYSSLNPVSAEQITVPVTRLDALVSDPDVVKIDVEGAELGVLRGSERLKSRPVYMFESGPDEVLGYTKADLWQWFQAHGYAVFLPNRLAHTAPPMGLEVFIDAHQYPRRATNYFGVPNEEVGRIKAKAISLLN